MSIVECIEVKKTYRQGKVEVQALRGISLSIEQGGFIALAGPSGSGVGAFVARGDPTSPTTTTSARFPYRERYR